MKTLLEIYQNFSSEDGHGDKGTAHSYIAEYERLLSPYRHGSSVMEIGLAFGESLKMWNEYFVDGYILGVDISDREIKPLLADPAYNILIQDATSPSILESIGDRRFDVIIDDGSHLVADQIKSFNILKGVMNSGGIYIIEDITKIDETKHLFEELHDNIGILDNRKVKGRCDDVLIVYEF